MKEARREGAGQQGWPHNRGQGPQSPGGEAGLGQVAGRDSRSAEQTVDGR